MKYVENTHISWTTFKKNRLQSLWMHKDEWVIQTWLSDQCSSVKVTVCSFPLLFVGQSAMLSALSQYSAAADPCCLPTFSQPAVTLLVQRWHIGCSGCVGEDRLKSVCCVQTRLGNDLHRHHSVTLEGIRNKEQCLIRSRFRMRSCGVSAL